MKKIINISLCVLACLLMVTGCGEESKKETNNDNQKELSNIKVNDIIDKIYEGISEDELPIMGSIEISEENMSYYLGVDDLKIEEGIASEPMMGSIAWSVVVIKLKDGENVNNIKKNIEKKVDPKKWVCVDAEIVKTISRGNYIMLIMMDEENEKLVQTIENNFNNI